MVEKPQGLVLIELLIVMTVFALFFIAFFMLVPAQFAKARDAVRKGNIDKLTKFIEDYYSDTDCYPVSIPLCGNSFTLGGTTYLADIPCDPETKNSYVYVSEISPCPKWFQIYGILEYTADSSIDEVGCRNGCGPECQFNYGAASSNVRLNSLCKETPIIPSTPGPTTTPGPPPLQYVCAPGGACEAFMYPELSGCPDIYLNDPTCQNNQCSTPKNRCHDARGKTN